MNRRRWTGQALATPAEETTISSWFDRPVFVHNYPRDQLLERRYGERARLFGVG